MTVILWNTQYVKMVELIKDKSKLKKKKKLMKIINYA